MRLSVKSVYPWTYSGALSGTCLSKIGQTLWQAAFRRCGLRTKPDLKANRQTPCRRKLHTSLPRHNVSCTRINLPNGAGKLAKVTICNAVKLNSVNESTLQDLTSTFQDLKHEEDIRVVILTGEEPHVKDGVKKAASFCGGADIHRMASLSSSEEAKAFITNIHHVCQSIRQLPAIVIARIHGLALGAGLEIAAACDFRYATTSSTLGMPEVRLGIPSVVEARLLANIIGWSKTREILFFGRTYSAKEAHAFHLIDQCSTTSEELDQLIGDHVKILTVNGPKAMKAQKRLINFWEENDLTSGTLAGIDEFAHIFEDGGSEPKRYMKAFTERKK